MCVPANGDWGQPRSIPKTPWFAKTNRIVHPVVVGAFLFEPSKKSLQVIGILAGHLLIRFVDEVQQRVTNATPSSTLSMVSTQNT